MPGYVFVSLRCEITFGVGPPGLHQVAELLDDTGSVPTGIGYFNIGRSRIATSPSAMGLKHSLDLPIGLSH
jgi:hypothetical protein